MQYDARFHSNIPRNIRAELGDKVAAYTDEQLWDAHSEVAQYCLDTEEEKQQLLLELLATHTTEPR